MIFLAICKRNIRSMTSENYFKDVSGIKRLREADVGYSFPDIVLMKKGGQLK